MRALVLALSIAAGLAQPAFADIDLFSRDTVSGLLDLRLAASSGEASWMDGGGGKTRFGGHGLKAEAADADLVWNPSIADVDAVIDLQAQPGAYHAGLAQAYLRYKPAPTSATRFNVKAGLFYPPVSMEHEGYAGGAWTVSQTITPSAINSWIGQEVKVVGAEGEMRRAVAEHELGATVGLFGFDDTAGTLLALRGWSLDDVTGVAFGRLPLPKLNSFLTPRQAPYTDPLISLDARVGYYARMDWRLPSRLALNLIYYDNLGDRRTDDRLQWAWATRFWNLGGRFDIDERTWLLGQAMTGNTQMGYPRGTDVWVNADFASTYLLATHVFGRASVTGRIDAFQVTDHPVSPAEDYGEHGWALTADYRYALTANVVLLGEVLHVASQRPAQAVLDLNPKKSQTTLQASARLSF